MEKSIDIIPNQPNIGAFQTALDFNRVLKNFLDPLLYPYYRDNFYKTNASNFFKNRKWSVFHYPRNLLLS